MTEELFTEVTQWQKETFKTATALSCANHLVEEAKELVDAITVNAPERNLEYADCLLLIFGAAARDGMSYDDIIEAIVAKMTINRKRKWGTPNEKGYVNHIQETH